MLPRITGLVVCRAIRREPPPDTPILMLTAKRATSGQGARIRERRRHYLTKPFGVRSRGAGALRRPRA